MTARVLSVPDTDPREEWPVEEAKRAYVEGEIDLLELEEALEDRLEGGGFSALPGEKQAAEALLGSQTVR